MVVFLISSLLTVISRLSVVRKLFQPVHSFVYIKYGLGGHCDSVALIVTPVADFGVQVAPGYTSRLPE